MAEALTAKRPHQSQNSSPHLFTVFGVSKVMTFGGNGCHPDIFSNWPRNFVIVLLAESLFIQPSARFVMVKSHESQDLKTQKDIHAPLQ